jgi:glycosyltransferase involved in cell wall biosynthesis
MTTANCPPPIANYTILLYIKTIMRLLYIADGRSPTARNWISYFIQQDHEVHRVSTSPCPDLEGLASLTVLPVAFSQVGGEASANGLRKLLPLGLRTTLRQWLGPLTLKQAAGHLSEVIAQIQPELVHAMRIPYEGILAAQARSQAPLIISVWGNDFTLHARANPVLGRLTRRTLKRTDALHTDCRRDLRLAVRYGFAADRPSVVLPGSGGVRGEIFHRLEVKPALDPPVVINPRGFRAYIRNDTFFKAIPLVLKQYPHARFICPAMAGNTEAERYLDQLNISKAVELLPMLTQRQLAERLRQAHIVVSPSTHDGTPNSLLEAIACGCFPVAGDIESIREWIEPGNNGLLVDPGDPAALANAIVTTIEDQTLRQRADEMNQRLIKDFAAYQTVMPQAEVFYHQVRQAAQTERGKRK